MYACRCECKAAGSMSQSLPALKKSVHPCPFTTSINKYKQRRSHGKEKCASACRGRYITSMSSSTGKGLEQGGVWDVGGVDGGEGNRVGWMGGGEGGSRTVGDD